MASPTMSEHDDTMNTGRLALRADAYYAEAAGEVVILTHQGTVVLNGASIHQWLDRLAPLLNGERTLRELTEGLAPPRRHLVEKIVSVLLERGVLRTVHTDEPHRLCARETAAYRAELDFIGYFRDSAGAAFERYRNATALVVGAGSLLPAVVRAAVRSGVRSVRAVTTPECPTETGSLPAHSGARKDVPSIRWWTGNADTTEELAALLDGVDLVVHVSDRPMVSRARLLDTLCAGRDLPLVQAMTGDGSVWVGPVGRVGADRPGASDGWHRLVALAGSGGRGPGSIAPAGAASVMPTVVANQIVQELFRHLTGAHPPEPPAPSRRGRMTRIEPDTLRGAPHDFLTHPFSLAATATATGLAELADRVGELAGGAALAPEEFSRRAAACGDARLGVFGEISERDFAQLPLHVTQTHVSDPVGLLGPAVPAPVVTGIGRDFASARYQAALRALAAYASLMVDPRRLLTRDGLGLVPPGDDPRPALNRVRGGESSGWVGALDLADQRPRLLPASTVFPALRDPATPYRPPRGVVAAFDWASAVRAGLVRHCRHLTVTAAARATTPFPLVGLAGRGGLAGLAGVDGAADLDEATRWCLDMAAVLGEPVTVYELTSVLGVPVLACLLGGRTMSYGCGLSAEDALRDGLLGLLRGYQSRADGDLAYAPAPVPELARRLRGTSHRPMSFGPALDVPDLVAALARCGRHAALVPLDHDQEVHQIMPYIAHVVVTDATR
jgi:putative thiazole-containing bacteriocin maturation protein